MFAPMRAPSPAGMKGRLWNAVLFLFLGSATVGTLVQVIYHFSSV
jgi:hypothetical protein